MGWEERRMREGSEKNKKKGKYKKKALPGSTGKRNGRAKVASSLMSVGFSLWFKDCQSFNPTDMREVSDWQSIFDTDRQTLRGRKKSRRNKYRYRSWCMLISHQVHNVLDSCVVLLGVKISLSLFEFKNLSLSLFLLRLSLILTRDWNEDHKKRCLYPRFWSGREEEWQERSNILNNIPKYKNRL